jgi:hypothetical protein
MDTTKRISGRFLLALLALLVVAALALNWYINDQEDQNVDRMTDDFIEACELDGSC